MTAESMELNKRRLAPPFLSVVLIIGSSGLIAQVLLLRELLVSFSGNEFIWSIILANWMVLEAIGVFVFGKVMDRLRNRFDIFVWLQLLFSLCLPLSILAARSFKGWLGFGFGQNIGTLWVFFSSLLIILPVSFTHGALFSGICELANTIGKVYTWEIIGTAIGGILLTFFLIPHFNSFQIAFFLVFLNLCLCFIYFRQIGKVTKTALVLITCLLVSFFISGGIPRISQFSLEEQWGREQVLDSQNSLYGNITVTERADQLTFFYNGLPIVTAPFPDITFVQEFAHFPLLYHDNPKNLLVISAGAGGLLNEALKHPLVKIDYAEIDPLIIKVLSSYNSAIIRRELTDNRVNLVNTDGRRFLNQTKNKYDVILIGLSRPADLSSNRFFTEEFFKLVKQHLLPKGILAFTLPGSLTYISPDLRDLNACVLAGLKANYRDIQVIPGDYNLFLATDSGRLTGITPALVLDKLNQRNIRTDIFNLNYLNYRLDPARRVWFDNSLQKATTKINHDFSPYAVLESVILWNKQFSGFFAAILQSIKSLNFSSLAFGIGILALGIFLFLRRKGNRIELSVVYCILTTGFFAMLVNLVLIFVFQVFYGYVYQKIGLLISSFMIGIAFGSILIDRILKNHRDAVGLFLRIEWAILLFAMFLSGILFYAERLSLNSTFLFILLLLIPGVLVGMQFPLAGKIYLKKDEQVGETVGILYAADLLGSWVAGILGGVILIPVLGFFYTCLVIFLFKLSSLIILSIFNKKNCCIN